MGSPDESKTVEEEIQQGSDGSSTVPKITIMRLELEATMKDEAVAQYLQLVREAPTAIEKDLATGMKKSFDQKYGQTWHCIVGKGFGCSIAYDAQYLLFFRADQHYVLLFKSTE